MTVDQALQEVNEKIIFLRQAQANYDLAFEEFVRTVAAELDSHASTFATALNDLIGLGNIFGLRASLGRQPIEIPAAGESKEVTA